MTTSMTFLGLDRKTELQRQTQLAAAEVNDLVFSYGRLAAGEPEREVLCQQVARVIDSWAQQVRSLGATPMDLWTVSLETAEEEWRWQYPCSSLVDLNSF